MKLPEEDWTCGGWEEQERDQLKAAESLTFRERLLWLQDADRLAARLERQRPWIDASGVLHAARPG